MYIQNNEHKAVLGTIFPTQALTYSVSLVRAGRS